MVQKESNIKGRDDEGGHYKREGWCMRTLQKGRDGEEGGHYKWEVGGFGMFNDTWVQ